MGLIKAESAPAVVRFQWRDIEAEAQARLGEAAAQAARIRESARAEGLQQGHEKGLADGLDEGKRLAVDEHAQGLESAIAALTKAAAELSTARQRVRSDCVGELVDLAVAVARRVTKQQAMFDPQVLIANLRESLGLAGRGRQLRVAIHPSQHQVLAQSLPQLQLEWPALGQAQIVEDPSLSPGGCRVFTDHGQIDADIEAQLDRVVADLMPHESEAAA